MSANCPKCLEPDARVIDSRPKVGGAQRRRKCDHCDHRWTTYEVLAINGEYPKIQQPDELMDMLHALNPLDRTIVYRIVRALLNDSVRNVEWQTPSKSQWNNTSIGEGRG